MHCTRISERENNFLVVLLTFPNPKPKITYWLNHCHNAYGNHRYFRLRGNRYAKLKVY